MLSGALAISLTFLPKAFIFFTFNLLLKGAALTWSFIFIFPETILPTIIISSSMLYISCIGRRKLLFFFCLIHLFMDSIRQSVLYQGMFLDLFKRQSPCSADTGIIDTGVIPRVLRKYNALAEFSKKTSFL